MTLATNGKASTLAQIKKMTVKQADRHVQDLGSGFVEARRTAENVTDFAVEATMIATTTGLIGGSSPTYTSEKFVNLFGINSASQVTYWKDLANAHYVIGIPMDNKSRATLWCRLRNSNAAQKDDVKKVLRDPKAKPADVERVIAKYVDKAGVKIVNRSTSGSTSGGGAAAKDVVLPARTPKDAEKRDGLIDSATGRIKRFAQQMDDKSFDKWSDSFGKWLVEQRKVRREAASKTDEAASA